jgi:hypothetical protein
MTLTVDVGVAVLSPSEAGVVGPFRLNSEAVAVSLKMDSSDNESLAVDSMLWSSSLSSSILSADASSSLIRPVGCAMISSFGSRMPASSQNVSKQVYPDASVNVATLLCHERGIAPALTLSGVIPKENTLVTIGPLTTFSAVASSCSLGLCPMLRA